MKKIYSSISLISLAFLINACGGGNGNGTTSGIVEIVNCDTNITTVLLYGDTLVKEDDNTTVTIVDVDSTSKTVCINTGSAHISR